MDNKNYFENIVDDKSEHIKMIYETLFWDAQDAIVIADDNQCVLNINDRFTELFGYELEDIIGRNLDNIIAKGNVVNEAKELTKSLINGKEINIDSIRYDSKGNGVEVNIKVVPIIINGEVVGGYGIYSDISKRNNAERELLKQNLKFKSLFMNSTDAIAMLDKNNCIININDEFTKLFGYELKDIKEIDIDKLITNEDTIINAEKLTNKVTKGEEVDFEEIRYDKDGNGKEVTIKGIPIVVNGEVVGIYAIYSDISLRKSVERELLKQNSNFKALFTNTKEAIVMLDETYCIVDINSEFTQLFGYKLEDVIGKNLDDIIGNDEVIDEAREITKDLFKGVVANSEGVRYGLEGIEREVSIRGVPIIIDGGVVGGYGIYSDISQRKNAQREITYMSYHDALTGLYNRRFFEEEISRLDTKRNYPLSIVFADVNGLKNTNDNYGHKKGDKLLKEAAKIIKSEFRSDDIIARIGGDEFIALLPKTKIEDSERIVDRIKKKCSESYIDSIEISIAFGVDAKIEPEQNINDIIKNAEDKMYCNKKKAKAAM